MFTIKIVTDLADLVNKGKIWNPAFDMLDEAEADERKYLNDCLSDKNAVFSSVGEVNLWLSTQGKELLQEYRKVKEAKRAEEAEACAYDIIDWLKKHNMWTRYIYIYANGKRYRCDTKTKQGKNDIFIEENVDPKDWLPFTGNFLCMSFENDFYDVVNGGEFYSSFNDSFRQLLQKYNKYYEKGNSWNLILCDM